MSDIFELIRILLSIGTVLVIPGYLVALSFYPGFELLESVQKFVLSISIGILLTIILGTSLITIGLGFKLITYFPPLILLSSILAYISRKKLVLEFQRLKSLLLPTIKPIILIIVISIAVTIIANSLVPLLVNNKIQRYTEFYVTDQNNHFPFVISANDLQQGVSLNVGIINHESQSASYIIKVLYADSELFSSNTIQIGNNESWEKIIPIKVLSDIGNTTTELDIFLYLNNSMDPYRKLYVTISK